jgi:uncharacterized protein
MSDVTAAQAPDLSGEQIDRILQAMAESFGHQLRSPILHAPSEEGLDYQDVTFPALDGVPLEGWFIPAAGSGTLIIANHPMGPTAASPPAGSSRRGTSPARCTMRAVAPTRAT